jgi:hypothetical protein
MNLNKKKMMLAGGAVLVGAAGVAIATSSYAAWSFDNNVIDVSQRVRVSVAGGENTVLTVKFKNNIGTGCSDNKVGQVTLFDPALLGNSYELQKESQSAVRQIALAALLSGRLVNVDVDTSGSCSAEGFRHIKWIVIR